MKKLLLFISLFSLALVSCQKEEIDEIFDQSPEERVNDQLSAVRSDLMSNDQGWMSTYTFNEGKTEFVVVMQFLEGNRAVISAPELEMQMESSYTLRYTQQIDLVFDTYSFLSLLVDYDYKADFRWELDRQEDGKYYFVSRAQSNEGESTLVLEKTTPEKLEYALNVQYIKSMMNPNPSKSFYRNLEIEGVEEKYAVSYSDGIVQFLTIKDGELVSFASEVTFNDNGFVLNNPIKVGDVTIEEFGYSDQIESFIAVKPEGVKAKIAYGSKPFAYPNSVDLFYGNPKHYFNVSTYSKKLKTAIDDLKSKDPAFNFLQIYVDYPLGGSPLNEFDYYRGTTSPRWIGFGMTYENNGVDEVTFKLSGVGQTAIDYYSNYCSQSFNMFWDQTFTIVPNGEELILVQNEDPSIWMVAKN